VNNHAMLVLKLVSNAMLVLNAMLVNVILSNRVERTTSFNRITSFSLLVESTQKFFSSLSSNLFRTFSEPLRQTTKTASAARPKGKSGRGLQLAEDVVLSNYFLNSFNQNFLVMFLVKPQ